MMRKANRRKPMAEINVVPYIDVTLVLLIIFMITAPLIQNGVEVDFIVDKGNDSFFEDGYIPVVQ